MFTTKRDTALFLGQKGKALGAGEDKEHLH
jgi:hypothetical protein